MHNRLPPDPSQPLDFDLTDISDARHALDELPPGITAVQAQQPGFWESRRRRAVPTDRALAGATMEWVVNLPPPLRPQQLCERYPRVANQLAAAWLDDESAASCFESLLNSRRLFRKGFPPEVAEEIVRLRDYRSALRAAREVRR